MTDDSWFAELAAALENDGIRALGHRFVKPGVSQFVLSTQPEVAPLTIVERTKGRLQYLVRDRLPKTAEAELCDSQHRAGDARDSRGLWRVAA